MSIYCKRCRAEVPDENVQSERNLAKCPQCGTIFKTTQRALTPSAQLLPPLTPKGISLEISDNALTITRRWFGAKYIFLTFFCLFWNAFLFFWAVDSTLWIYLACPHGWVGLGMIYYVLSGYLNSTEMRVTPNYLTVKHGPLPYWGNKHIYAHQVKQLYVKENIHRNKDSVSYTYEVWMREGYEHKAEKLVDSIANPEQAFFLEQEIERHLGIKDEKVPGEHKLPARHRDISWKAWKAVAQSNHLNFRAGKLLESVRVSGYYRGYDMGMMAFLQNDRPYTRVVLARTQLSEESASRNYDTDQPLAALFNSLRDSLSSEGVIKIEPGAQKLTYEQPEVETNETRLKSNFDLLCDLLDTYPTIVALGGEAMPILRSVAANKHHLLQSAATQLIAEIAPTTLHLRHQTAKLWCKRCLVHCAEHETNISWLQALVYYGCRACHQSYDFFSVKRAVAVLDNGMTDELLEQGQILRVNWIVRQKLFDFDSVEIIKASDEQIERFAVQIGNDTNPKRQPRYKNMACIVSANCDLSPNTMRILQRTFGVVEVS